MLPLLYSILTVEFLLHGAAPLSVLCHGSTMQQDTMQWRCPVRVRVGTPCMLPVLHITLAFQRFAELSWTPQLYGWPAFLIARIGDLKLQNVSCSGTEHTGYRRGLQVVITLFHHSDWMRVRHVTAGHHHKPQLVLLVTLEPHAMQCPGH